MHAYRVVVFVSMPSLLLLDLSQHEELKVNHRPMDADMDTRETKCRICGYSSIDFRDQGSWQLRQQWSRWIWDVSWQNHEV